MEYFDPLIIRGKRLHVQPILTPDRDSRGRRIFMKLATDMIRPAATRIYLENQSFNLLEDNVDEFEEFFGVLRDKQQAGLDVRIIFRDPREFGAANIEGLQKLLERLKDFGFDTDNNTRFSGSATRKASSWIPRKCCWAVTTSPMPAACSIATRVY